MRALARFLMVKCGMIPKPDFVARIQRDHPTPKQLDTGSMVIVRDGLVDKWICFRCPGGCGEKVMLNLSPSKSPRWRVEIDWLRRPTVEPSILQVSVCRCHFWIRKGAINWCSDSGHAGISRSMNA